MLSTCFQYVNEHLANEQKHKFIVENITEHNMKVGF